MNRNTSTLNLHPHLVPRAYAREGLEYVGERRGEGIAGGMTESKLAVRAAAYTVSSLLVSFTNTGCTAACACCPEPACRPHGGASTCAAALSGAARTAPRP